MRKKSGLLIFLSIFYFFSIIISAHAKPSIPLEDMSDEIPNDLKDKIRTLYSNNDKRIAKALDYLGKNGERASVSVPFLLSMMGNLMISRNPGDNDTLCKVIEALGGIGDARALPDLISALDHRNKKVSGTAVAALGNIKDAKAIDPLIALLRKDKHVERVMDALSGMGEPAVTPLLNEFNGNDYKVRVNAAYILGELGFDRAVDPLIAALKEDNKDVAKACAFALGEIGDHSAIDPLIDALSSGDLGLRSNAAGALGKIKSPLAVEPLIKALKDPEKLMRISAIRALGAIKDERAVLPLINAFEERDWNVQRYLDWALKNITGKKLPKNKEIWLKWYNEEGKK